LLFDILDAALVVLVPKLAEYFVWLGGIVTGNFVAWGDHWGKLPWSEKFKSPERVFAWLLIFAAIALLATDFLSPSLQSYQFANVDNLPGITSGVIGAFYVWFFYSGDWDLRRNYRWVPPLVCFALTAANIYLTHCSILATTC